METFHLLLIALVVVVGMMVIFWVVGGQKRADRARALSVMSSAAGAGKKDDAQKRRADISKTLKENAKQRNNEKQSLSTIDRIRMAGLDITVGNFWIASMVSMCLFFGLANYMGAPMLAKILMPIVGLIGFPRFVLRFMSKRRQKKFLEGFADALDSMVRLLKAGMPPSEAIAMVAREYEGPVGEEMEHIYDSQRVGISLPEASLEAAKRMPITEMKMFATGMSIQQQTGASLSEVLTNLAGVLRARYRLRRKVDALSSEAKASALIIGSLPLLVATGMYFVNRPYIELLWTSDAGERLLYGSAFWMSLGALVMRQMINFKV